MTKVHALIFVGVSILLSVYAQLVVKWQVGKMAASPESTWDRVRFVTQVISSPWTMSALACGALIAGAWILALSRLPLTYAYPLMSLTFPLILVGGALFFHESVSLLKIVGVLLIAAGIVAINLDS